MINFISAFSLHNKITNPRLSVSYNIHFHCILLPVAVCLISKRTNKKLFLVPLMPWDGWLKCRGIDSTIGVHASSHPDSRWVLPCWESCDSQCLLEQVWRMLGDWGFRTGYKKNWRPEEILMSYQQGYSMFWCYEIHAGKWKAGVVCPQETKLDDIYKCRIGLYGGCWNCMGNFKF